MDTMRPHHHHHQQQLLLHHHLLLLLPTSPHFLHLLPSACPYPPARARHSLLTCLATRKGWNPDPSKDTRIHWSSPDEGWIGRFPDPSPSSARDPDAASLSSASSSVLDSMLSSLLSQARDTHYEFLGVPPSADVEQIKAAYRKLSKLYHPDSTPLPLEMAAEKFLRLKKAYNILSSVEERRVYDQALAQEVSRQQGDGFIWPYEADRTQRGSSSETISKKASPKVNDGYVELDGQMQTALLFDFFAFFVAFCSIIYVAFFKQ